MPALIKEILLDYAIDSLSSEDKADIEMAIRKAVAGNSTLNWRYVREYLSGYSTEEIATLYNTTITDVTCTLHTAFSILEYNSGYTDERFIRATAMKYKYPRSSMYKMLEFLEKHGKSFNETKEVM